MTDGAMLYEKFIKLAFKLGTGKSISRWGDPARLANTDTFSSGNLYEVKAGTAYSMQIFIAKLDRNLIKDDEARNQIELHLRLVIDAETVHAISEAIKRFWRNVIDHYYDIENDGGIKLKSN